MACIFCGHTRKMTIEHVSARWARDAIAEMTGGPAIVRQVWADRPDETLRTDTGLSIRLPDAICENCNNGWLSRWEDTVGKWLEPGVRGSIIAIAEGDMQRRVAAWAIKTALLFVMTIRLHDQIQGFVPDASLRWLYEHRDNPEPPPGSYVWLGRIDITATAAHATGGALGNRNKPEHREAFVVAFSIGRLGLLVFGQDFRGVAPYETVAGTPIKVVSLPRDLAPKLVGVWPDGLPLVIWPPSVDFTEDEFRRLALDFSMSLTRRSF